MPHFHRNILNLLVLQFITAEDGLEMSASKKLHADKERSQGHIPFHSEPRAESEMRFEFEFNGVCFLILKSCQPLMACLLHNPGTVHKSLARRLHAIC